MTGTSRGVVRRNFILLEQPVQTTAISKQAKTHFIVQVPLRSSQLGEDIYFIV